MKLFRNLIALVALTFVFASCSQYSKVEKSKDTDYKLIKADEYYAKKKYRHAQELYEALFPFLKAHKNLRIYIISTRIVSITRSYIKTLKTSLRDTLKFFQPVQKRKKLITCVLFVITSKVPYLNLSR